MPEPEVTVCIATFRRPQLLKSALDSVVAQEFEFPAALKIVVVDNDVQQTAKETVDEYRHSSVVEITYDVEPIQNIALARNRALAHAEGKYVAFIDDDEVACANWLAAMISAAKQYAVGVVFGPVIPVVPKEAPDWVRRGTFFVRERHQTGHSCKFGKTGNVLLDRKLLESQRRMFDPAYGLTGGSDTEFFARLGRDGVAMIWCDEAIVKEFVLPERMCVAWLARRAFRGGQSFARIFVARMTLLRKCGWFLQRTLFLLLAALGVVLSFWRKDRMVKSLQAVARNAGQLSYLVATDFYKEYQSPGQG